MGHQTVQGNKMVTDLCDVSLTLFFSYILESEWFVDFDEPLTDISMFYS